MIRHQAPCKYLASVGNMFLTKQDEMQVVSFAEKDWFLIIASAINMI